MTDKNSPIIVSLEGNIGAGKTTLLNALREAMPYAEFVDEPVGVWTTLTNNAGKSLLEVFYEDKKRWAFTFQQCAFLSRLCLMRDALRVTKKRVIITERSVLTDREVFATMLRDSGDMDAMEWDLYNRWFTEFAESMPIRGIIYITTGVGTSAERIVKRGRHGEEHIPLDYLAALDAQHQRWLDNTPLPVIRITTEPGAATLEQNVAGIRAFVGALVAATEPPITEAELYA
jgi:deoxycitidine kinase/deoxyguanosine kinase